MKNKIIFFLIFLFFASASCMATEQDPSGSTTENEAVGEPGESAKSNEHNTNDINEDANSNASGEDNAGIPERLEDKDNSSQKDNLNNLQSGNTIKPDAKTSKLSNNIGAPSNKNVNPANNSPKNKIQINSSEVEHNGEEKDSQNEDDSHESMGESSIPHSQQIRKGREINYRKDLN